MEMLKGKKDIGCVELGCILFEPTNLTQVEEELTTRAVLEAEEQLGVRLEGVVHLDDVVMVHTLLRKVNNTGIKMNNQNQDGDISIKTSKEAVQHLQEYVSHPWYAQVGSS